MHDPEVAPLPTEGLDRDLLEVRDLSVSYGQVQAVRGISFSVPAGKAVSLIGANGAGKTSTLGAIAGLVRPSGGKVVFEGENVTGLPAHAMVRRGLVLVPEGRQILAGMTVAENLELGGYQRMDTPALVGEIQQIYHRFPILGDRRHMPAGSLSGGEQQMLAIARGLLAHPRLLMLDEPSMGLAPRLVSEVFDILREVRDAGTTLLLVEQNARKALALTEQAYVLQTGQIAIAGRSEALLDDPGLIAAYLGTSRIEDDAG